jgi:hypothetical protein
MAEQPKVSSEGQPTIPESQIEARGLVTHEYHLRVIRALVAERDEARTEIERLERKVAQLNETAQEVVGAIREIRLTKTEPWGHRIYDALAAFAALAADTEEEPDG